MASFSSRRVGAPLPDQHPQPIEDVRADQREGDGLIESPADQDVTPEGFGFEHRCRAAGLYRLYRHRLRDTVVPVVAGAPPPPGLLSPPAPAPPRPPPPPGAPPPP